MPKSGIYTFSLTFEDSQHVKLKVFFCKLVRGRWCSLELPFITSIVVVLRFGNTNECTVVVKFAEFQLSVH